MVLNSTSVGSQYNPDVTELSDGRILVTFANYGDDSVLARVINQDGSLQGQDVQLNTTTDGDQEAGDVAALADGRAVAVWYEQGSDSDQTGSYIRAQVIGADGQPEGDDFVVSAALTNRSLPAITALADGGALVVWHGENSELRGHLLNADGRPVSADFVISSTVGYGSSAPALEALADGRVLVSWNSVESSNGLSVTRGVYFTPEMGADGADALAGTAGLDVMMGLGGNDVLTGGVGDDSQMGGTGQDKLLGGTGDDLMVGENGADVLNGGRGEDLLNGGAARDVLSGGAGEDVLTGGAGRDILTGGSGADTFYFDMGFGRDKIMDFSDGDMLQISDEMWSGTAESLVADHAWVTDDGVMIDFGGGDRISLVGLGTLDGLADAITFL
jgi:Ca2+-binding RTX toxin-like protein